MAKAFMTEKTHSAQSFEALKLRLQEEYANLPKRLKQAADFVMAHPDDVALGTVAEIAASAEVQPSTLVRLAQTLGYGGYSEMQQFFRARLKESWPDYQARLEALKALGPEEHSGLHLSGVADAAVTSIARLRVTIDPAKLEQAVDILTKADTIFVVGARRVFPVTTYLAYALAKMGVRCALVDHIGQMGGEQIACARPGDAVLAVSFTPYAQSTIDLSAAAARSGVPVVAITDSVFSPLVTNAKLWLEVAESDYGAFRSLSATMSLVMAIAISIGERREGKAR
jgi:DNA-binding MurR/RpiR family transcriptional regulator